MGEELNELMVQWFTKMGVDVFVPTEVVQKECKLLCPPQMKDIWNNVIYHVRPVDEIKHITKTLLLHYLSKNKKYSGKKIKVPVSSVKKLEILEKYEVLYQKLSHCNHEIAVKKSEISNLTTLLNKRNRAIDDLTNASKNAYRLCTILNLKKHAVYEKLHKLIELADSIKSMNLSLKKAASSEQDAFSEMYLKNCLTEMNILLESRFKSRELKYDGIEKVFQNFLRLNIPLKVMNHILIEHLQLSMINISKLMNSDDIRRSVSDIRYLHSSYENYLQNTIKEGKNKIIEKYLHNRRFEENIKSEIIKIKNYKTELFTKLQQKSEQHHPAKFEELHRADFDSWITSELKVIVLEKRKDAITQFKLQDISEKKTSAYYKNQILEQYLTETTKWNDTKISLKCQISSYVKDCPNDSVRENLNQLEDFISITRNKHKKLQFMDAILKEFNMIESIPYDVLTSKERTTICNLSCAELSELINICCWLRLVKHQNFASSEFIQPLFNSDAIRNRAIEISAEETKFTNSMEDFINVLKHKLVIRESEVENCKRVLQIWKSFPKYGDYIPNCIVYDGEDFKFWFKKFLKKIRNISVN